MVCCERTQTSAGKADLSSATKARENRMKYGTSVYALKLNLLFPPPCVFLFFFVAHIIRRIKSFQYNIPLSLKLWCLVEARSCLEGEREGGSDHKQCHGVFRILVPHLRMS